MTLFFRLKALMLTAVTATAAATISAAPSVLSLSQYANDSTLVLPESFETDTQKMMENWYLRNYTALDADVDRKPDANVTDEVIIQRLAAIPTTIELPYNSIVRAYIDAYTGKNRRLVENMLGMSLYYMPIFEQALEREGLPMELKYLPVIESAMNPDAVSRSGATGLWQLMLQTARGYDMEVNTLVDERRDPIESSRVAAKMLHDLYDIYHDWSLAIAAYNCGPGNINKALRRCTAEKKDFWTIYPYLPKETRGYVPCFIAATYVMNYYKQHNISPALAKKPILTDSVHVERRVYFQQISDVLQIPVEELKVLNPQYREECIPGEIRPYSLVLPANQVYSYIMSEDAICEHNAELYARRTTVEPSTGEVEGDAASADAQQGEWVTTEKVSYHKVKKGETMQSIAKKYGVSVWSLKHANGNISTARRGQTLKVVTTEKTFKPSAPAADASTDVAAATPATTSAAETKASSAPAAETTHPVAHASKAKPVEQPAEAAEADAEEEVAETAEPAAAQPAKSAQSASVANAFAKAETAKADSAAKAESAAKNSAKETASATTSSKDKASKAATNTSNSKSSKNSKKKKDTSKTVTAKSGDSLARIAKKNGTTVAELKKLNGIKGNNTTIQPGQKIRVK
jgi:membrane-bound lytic murein transglycosylase D